MPADWLLSSLWLLLLLLQLVLSVNWKMIAIGSVRGFNALISFLLDFFDDWNGSMDTCVWGF